MQAEAAAWLDWRDPAAYAPLLDADRSLFAWEWLRRDEEYRLAAALALAGPSSAGRGFGPGRFGLVAFEPPGAAVPDARPVWNAAAHPYVVNAQLAPGGPPEDSFELGRLRGLVRILETGSAAHLLLSDGFRTIRLDAPAGTFGCSAPRLRYTLEGLASAEAPLLGLRRFLALCRNGRFSPALHPPEARARRLILMLRAFDGLACGADQREVAAMLLSRLALEPRWRTHEPSLRSQVQRLVRSVRQMRAGAWLRLLE